MNIGKEIALLKGMTVTELRKKYIEVFGEKNASRHKDYLVKRIAWRLQSLAEGDLSDRAQARAGELARDADIRVTVPKSPLPSGSKDTRVGELRISSDKRLPMPGAVLAREYKGRMVAVTVLPNGFEYDGKVFRSLSAVAREISGTHWNGYHFFNLNKNGGVHA